jgi:hypothetical protein
MSEVSDQMIAYDGQEGRVAAYLAGPDTQEPRPAIVVIHDIYGLSDHTKDVARRFAGQGYVALAPHLFSRPSLAEVLTYTRAREAMRFAAAIPREKFSDRAFIQEQAASLPEADRKRVLETLPVLFGGLPRDSLVEDLVAAVEYLDSQPGLSCAAGGLRGLLWREPQSHRAGEKHPLPGSRAVWRGGHEDQLPSRRDGPSHGHLPERARDQDLSPCRPRLFRRYLARKVPAARGNGCLGQGAKILQPDPGPDRPERGMKPASHHQATNARQKSLVPWCLGGESFGHCKTFAGKV